MVKFFKKKIWYLYTMEFYSATRKNEILSFASKWMELENIILSEVSQAQKARRYMLSLICGVYTEYKYSNIRNTGHTKRRSCVGGAG
jgi:hypothetical protein